MNPSECLVLDASCLLNLYATGRLREIALAVAAQLKVADYVLEREALYTWHTDPSGIRVEAVPLDLTLLVKDGLIRVIQLDHPEEQSTFVALAALVDDGESATAALALHRGCSIATDDRKARRVFGEFMPDVPLVTTLDLMKLWVDESQLPTDELRAAMDAMRDSASYMPSSRDPLFQWWASIMSSGE